MTPRGGSLSLTPYQGSDEDSPENAAAPPGFAFCMDPGSAAAPG